VKRAQFCEWFGNKVKRRRMELRINQADLAEVMEIPRTAIIAIESGRREVSFYEAKILHSCLGIRPDYAHVSEAIAKRHVNKLKVLTDKRIAQKFSARIGRMEGEE
jgi:DNA-binding XRE family transcriptional regulator